MLGSQYVVTLLFVYFVMAMAIIIKNNVISMIIAVCTVSYTHLDVYKRQVYDIVLSKTNSNFHGRISGVIQASCNLSETFGIYIGGVLLGLKCYWLFFGVSIIYVSYTHLDVYKRQVISRLLKSMKIAQALRLGEDS